MAKELTLAELNLQQVMGSLRTPTYPSYDNYPPPVYQPSHGYPPSYIEDSYFSEEPLSPPPPNLQFVFEKLQQIGELIKELDSKIDNNTRILEEFPLKTIEREKPMTVCSDVEILEEKLEEGGKEEIDPYATYGTFESRDDECEEGFCRKGEFWGEDEISVGRTDEEVDGVDMLANPEEMLQQPESQNGLYPETLAPHEVVMREIEEKPRIGTPFSVSRVDKFPIIEMTMNPPIHRPLRVEKWVVYLKDDPRVKGVSEENFGVNVGDVVLEDRRVYALETLEGFELESGGSVHHSP